MALGVWVGMNDALVKFQWQNEVSPSLEWSSSKTLATDPEVAVLTRRKLYFGDFKIPGRLTICWGELHLGTSGARCVPWGFHYFVGVKNA